jgi:glycosidase
MPNRLDDAQVAQAIARARANADSAFPSPVDWRGTWVYFVFLDRFNNPDRPPAGRWDGICPTRQGGTFKGVTARLDYLKALGCGAVWLTPVLKNPRPDDWLYNYHGYAAQDFLNLDERFASDGTRATAEAELEELVAQAQARGMAVILDIVINHAARVFDYVIAGGTRDVVADAGIMNCPLGQEPHVRWLNGLGYPRGDWQDAIPAGTPLSADDAVYPEELRNDLFFRRRGSKLDDRLPRDASGEVAADAFVRGDFDTMRQMVVEYDASVPGQEAVRAVLGKTPVLSVLVRAYSYLIARYGFDGFRIDTVKYVHPQMVEYFGNAIREFALSIGKRNFFTFGEIYDDEEAIAAFVGRNGPDAGSFGIDAALDFPLFYVLPAVAKGFRGVEGLRSVFEARKQAEKGLISSHGEAGRYFVSFLDNHDQHERFNHPLSDPHQITLGLAIMFCLQGIPAIYYGTEQGLDGTRNGDGQPDLSANESVREALWGKTPQAFDSSAPIYQAIRQLGDCRASHPALRFGRLYFREVSGNGRDFGQSSGTGGIVAFSRILADSEAVLVANTSTTQPFKGFVLCDPDLNHPARMLSVAYSNYAKTGSGQVGIIADAKLYSGGTLTWTGSIAAAYVELEPMEVQMLA